MSEPLLLEGGTGTSNTIVPEADLSNGFFEAPLVGCASPVRVGYSAIRSLHAGFSGVESIGLLLGSTAGEAIHIERCELLSRAANLRRGILRQVIQSRCQNRADGVPEVLGIIRTQTSGVLGATESDSELAKECFPSGGILFLVVRTFPDRPWLAALTTLGSNLSAKPVSLEFPFDEHLLRGEPSEMAPVQGYLPVGDAPASLLLEPAPDAAPTSWIPRGRWLIAALVGIILAGGAGVYRWTRMAGPSVAGDRTTVIPEPLAFKVTRNGKDFEVSWNPLSKGIRKAFAGTLTIRDGTLNRTVQLDETQLREGRFVYAALFEELSFRLEVLSDDLHSQAESVLVLTWSAKPPGDVLPGSPATPDSPKVNRVSQALPR